MTQRWENNQALVGNVTAEGKKVNWRSHIPAGRRCVVMLAGVQTPNMGLVYY